MLTIKEVIRTLYNALSQKLKNHRGDWNQNDPTADDYIKNRPFYKSDDLVTLVNTTFTTYDDYEWCAPFYFEPIKGTTYYVTYNGIQYQCKAYMNQHGETCTGNMAVIGEGADTGEPFLYIWFNEGSGVIVEKAGTHTISIKTKEIVKINKEFLPSDLVSIDEISDAFDYVYDEMYSMPNVSYGYIQSLSTEQKRTARNNIGAVSSDDITGVVKYTSQTLTDAQKTQARMNIGAGTSNFDGSYNSLTDIPETPIQVQSDWNIFDNTKADYIKNRIAYHDCLDTLVICNTNSKQPLHTALDATTLTDYGYYSYKIITQFGDLDHYDNIVMDGIKYQYVQKIDSTKFDQHVIARIYGNTSLIPVRWIDNNPHYQFLDRVDNGADFALIKGTKVQSNGSTYITYYLFSKEEGYQLPEVYTRTENLKQLDEKFIPDTIARITDIPEVPATSVAHQQLVTNADGNTVWTDRTHWKEESVKTLVDNITLDSTEDSNFINPFELELKTGNTYTVVLDGVAYDCVAAEKTMYGETFVFIGNKSVVGEEIGTEPFAIICTRGMVSVTLMESAVHTINITKKAVEYHALDPNYLPPIQVEHPRYSYDLEANDPKSLNYVKGRTHYVEYNLETLLEETKLVSERDTYNTNSKYVIPLTEVIDFPDPTIKYVVKYDGQEYCFEARQAVTNNEQYWGVGNLRRLTSREDWDDSGEPFFIGTHTERGTFVFTSDAEPVEHQISVAVETGQTVHQLDRKFIPGPLVINVVSDLTDWDGTSDIEVDIDKTYRELEYNYESGIDLVAHITIPIMNTISGGYNSENRRELILHHDATLISKPTHIQTGNVYGDEDNFLFVGICKNVASARVIAGQEISDGSVMLYTLSVLYGREKATLHVNRLPALTGDDLILNSSTEGSTKRFKLTIDDSGVLTATEIVE